MRKLKKLNWVGQVIVYAFTMVLGGMIGAFMVDINVSPDNIHIEVSTKPVEGKLEKSDGTTQTIEIPTIEGIDGGKFEEEVPDLGQGETYDISTPDGFYNSVIGKCIDLDHKYGAQCMDGFAAFHHQYTDRWLSTAATHAAKGLWTDREKNAGDDYELIYNVNDVKSGDWVVWSTGQYGHVAMAMSGVHDGYITVIGENQGGPSCSGGGAAFNVINLSVKGFSGAFRPKIYVEPETPEEPDEPVIEPCHRIEVQPGDTMGEIMQRCEGKVDYSQMDAYARSWQSVKIKPGQTVYDGWKSETGVGLYAGDVIERV